jgi:acyl dehydratase
MQPRIGEEFVFSERIDGQQPLLYAAAAGEYFTPRHIDSAFAQRLGYPEILIDGFLTMGLVSKAVVSVVGHPDRIQELHLKYIAPVFLNDTLEIRVRVVASNEDAIELAIGVVNQHGAKVFDDCHARAIAAPREKR